MTPAQSETLLREALEECRDKLNIFRLSDLKDKAAIEAADYAIAMADTALQSIPEPLLDEGLAHRLSMIGLEYASKGLEREAATITDALAALSIPRLEAGRVTEAMIEAGAREFRQAHQNTCYPDASDNEARWAAEAIYLAMSSASAPDGEDR